MVVNHCCSITQQETEDKKRRERKIENKTYFFSHRRTYPAFERNYKSKFLLTTPLRINYGALFPQLRHPLLGAPLSLFAFSTLIFPIGSINENNIDLNSLNKIKNIGQPFIGFDIIFIDAALRQ